MQKIKSTYVRTYILPHIITLRYAHTGSLFSSFIISLWLCFSPGDVVVDHYLNVLGGWNGSASGVVPRTTGL